MYTYESCLARSLYTALANDAQKCPPLFLNAFCLSSHLIDIAHESTPFCHYTTLQLFHDVIPVHFPNLPPGTEEDEEEDDDDM
jgi:hypothetical protein